MKNMKRIVLPIMAVIAAAALAALAGWLALDNEAQAQTTLPPPTNVQVADGDYTGRVMVSWDAADGAAGYSVRWVNVDAARVVNDAGGDWTIAIQSVDVGATANTLTVNGLAPGTEYSFGVGSKSSSAADPAWSGWNSLTPQGDRIGIDVYDAALLQSAALGISGHASALVAASGPTHAGMIGNPPQSAGVIAGLKASLNAQLALLPGRGDAMRVARIQRLVGTLIANAEAIQQGRGALLQALAAEQAGQSASNTAELFAAGSVSLDDQFDVLMMDEDSVSEADRLRYSHLQSLLGNVRQARTLLLVAARMQDPAVVARNQEAYESVAELIQRDIGYLRGNGGSMSRDERIAIAGAQGLVDEGSDYFTRLEKRLELMADERGLIARNAVALSRLQAELGALAAEAQGMTPPEVPTPPTPTGTPGVTADMITFGQSAAFSGPSQDLGKGMYLGILAAFEEANDAGGVQGRRLFLERIDDGYEPDRAFSVTRTLIEDVKAFGLIGAVGTPTSRAALPLAEAGDVPFVGAFTGAQLLREDDQDFILNVRASYHDETERMVAYLESMGKTKVAVLYQNDSYGQDGLKGVENALKQPGREDMTLVQSWYYGRNTTAVKAAAFRINKAKPDAVIIIGGYAPTAKFIEQLRIRMMDAPPVFMAVSFVGSNALRDELVRLEESRSDVFVTQVVPLPSDESNQLVAAYRAALSAHDADAEPGFISLEGYIAGRLAIERLEACGAVVTRECFLNVFSEDTPPIDIAGLQLQYGPGDNQGSDAVFLTRINDAGQFELVAE